MIFVKPIQNANKDIALNFLRAYNTNFNELSIKPNSKFLGVYNQKELIGVVVEQITLVSVPFTCSCEVTTECVLYTNFTVAPQYYSLEVLHLCLHKLLKHNRNYMIATRDGNIGAVLFNSFNFNKMESDIFYKRKVSE